MADDKILSTQIYPLVEKALSKKQNTEALQVVIGNFLDKNNDKLTTLGPIHKIFFTEEDMNKLYKIIEVDPQFIKKIIKTTDAIKDNWQIMNNPFNSAIAMTIRYYKIQKNEDMAKKVMIYLTMSMYPTLQHKYFEFEPNEDIMNYTINNLSNKYKIKQVGTFYHAMIDTTFVNDQNAGDRLIRGTDKDVVDYICAVKTRLNMLLRKLANEFYKNKEKNVFLNTEKTKVGELQNSDIDSNIYAIERISNSIVLRLSIDGPNFVLINIAAKFNKVSINELRNYITTLTNGENREKIKSIVESILFLFLFNPQNTIQEVNSDKFLMYCLELYKKSNTSDQNIIKIKKILDDWLDNDLEVYKKTQQLSTINNFRKAIFTFFVITIQSSSVH